MAITNVALQDKIGGAPGDPVFTDVVTLSLDASYPAGGYVGFTASVEGQIGLGKTILEVNQNNVPGSPAVYVAYDRTLDALVCYVWATGVEVAGGVNLSGVVGLELVIRSK